MDESHFNLRWRSHTYTFVNFLDHFRQQDLFCDATISCDGQTYSVHKVVLSACSSFFATVFANTDSQNPVVVLQDVDRTQLESLLSYMYRGEVRVPQPDLPLFIQLAESLQVKGLAIPTTTTTTERPSPYLPPRNGNSPWHDGNCGPPEKRTRLSDGMGELQTMPDASIPHPLYAHKEVNRPAVCQDVNMNHAETRIPNMMHADHRIPDLNLREQRMPSMMHAEQRIPHMKYSDHRIPHMKQHSGHRIPRPYDKEHTTHNQSEHQNFGQQEYNQVVTTNEMKWNNERSFGRREESLVHNGGLFRGSTDLKSPSGQSSVPANDVTPAADRETSPASMFSVPAERMTSPGSRFSIPAEKEPSPTTRFRVPAERVTSPGSRFSVREDAAMSPSSRFTVPTNTEVSPASRYSVPAEKEASPGPKFNTSQSRGTFQNLVISEEPQRIKEEPQDVPDDEAAEQGILQDAEEGLHRDSNTNQSEFPHKTATEGGYTLSIPDKGGYSLKIVEANGYTFEMAGKRIHALNGQEDNSHTLGTKDDTESLLHTAEENTDTKMMLVEDGGYGHLNPHSRTTPDHHQFEMDCQDSNSSGDSGLVLKDSMRTPPPSQPQPTIGSSQLRRELLRPLQQKAPNTVQLPRLTALQTASPGAPQLPQSIPHPVIAPRPTLMDRSRREPPPLMKMPLQFPLMMSDNESLKVSHEVKDDLPQESSSSSNHPHTGHLLVKAPPTYRSFAPLPPNPFSQTLNPKQNHSLMVNGRSVVTDTPQGFPVNRMTLPHNDYPVNLCPTKPPVDLPKKNTEDPFLGKILTNRKKRLRGPKSWEYLVRLLKDPTTNPYLIRWENEAKGVFRLVQPAVIAQKWGRRTGKHASECLSYENFARGLRYHYATGALQPVSERSFVYRFGPKALKTLQDSDETLVPKFRVLQGPQGRLPRYHEQQQQQQQQQQKQQQPQQDLRSTVKGMHEESLPSPTGPHHPRPQTEVLVAQTSLTEAFQLGTVTATYTTSDGVQGIPVSAPVVHPCPPRDSSSSKVPSSPPATVLLPSSPSDARDNTSPSVSSHDE